MTKTNNRTSNRSTNKNTGGDSAAEKTEKAMDDTQYRAKIQHRWLDFSTESRCYVEGIYLEAGQTITLSPAAAYRQRTNRNLRATTEVTWPEMSKEQVKSLAEGDPKVGPAPKDFTLVQPGSGATPGGSK